MTDHAGVPVDTAIDVRGLRMDYGRTRVLRGIDFQARRGEVLTILGPNGAGKSTTIEILEGFRMRTAGQVSVLGDDPAHASDAWRARVGIVLQSWRDHGRWRVRELLDHLGRYYDGYSTPKHRRPRPTDELLEAVGLAAQADKKVSALSGGQRRRLDVAVGIVGNPELLFLDEPTTGFDPEARHEFHELIRTLALTETTILLTTHDLTEAQKLADRILILVAGGIVADGTAADLAARASVQDEVRWTRDGKAFRESTPDSAAFVQQLFASPGGPITDLSVEKADLESVYLALVREAEAIGESHAAQTLLEVSR